MSNIIALAPRRVLVAAKRLPCTVRRLFTEDMHDLLQLGGRVTHPDYQAAIAGRTVSVFINGTLSTITDDDLSRIVAELVHGVRTEVG